MSEKMNKEEEKTREDINDILKHSANLEIERIQNYLAKRNIYVTEGEIVLAAIRIARRLCAGDWTFAVEFLDRKKRKKNELERRLHSKIW